MMMAPMMVKKVVMVQLGRMVMQLLLLLGRMQSLIAM
jgi:hypothetical protein